MATCKECFHYDVCKIIHFPSMFGLTGDGCEHYKNKADVIDIPDDTIMYIQDKWLVINTESEDLGKTIKCCLDYLTKDLRMDGDTK